MKYEEIYERLTTTGVAYILDDFEGVAVRLVHGQEGTMAYAKRNGKKEFKTKTSEKYVFNVVIEGKEITKEEYDSY